MRRTTTRPLRTTRIRIRTNKRITNTKKNKMRNPLDMAPRENSHAQKKMDHKRKRTRMGRNKTRQLQQHKKTTQPKQTPRINRRTNKHVLHDAQLQTILKIRMVPIQRIQQTITLRILRRNIQKHITIKI